jgi:GRASP55/65 PDZ-like domain
MGNQPVPNNGFGLRVIHVSFGSPAQVQGLEAFSDFIVGVSEVNIPNFKEELSNYLSRNAGKEVILAIYSVIKRDYREIRVVPSKTWPNADSLLGVRVKWESFTTAQENIFRVSKVWPGSPGAQAGLKEGEDFVLGSPQFDYETFERFLFNVNYSFTHMDKPRIELNVYNIKEDKTRMVAIVPSRDWGGEGLLGTELSMGYLNDITTIQKSDTTIQTVGSIQALDEFNDSPERSPPFHPNYEHAHLHEDGGTCNHSRTQEHSHESGTFDHLHGHSHTKGSCDNSHSYDHSDGHSHKKEACDNSHSLDHSHKTRPSDLSVHFQKREPQNQHLHSPGTCNHSHEHSANEDSPSNEHSHLTSADEDVIEGSQTFVAEDGSVSFEEQGQAAAKEKEKATSQEPSSQEVISTINFSGKKAVRDPPKKPNAHNVIIHTEPASETEETKSTEESEIKEPAAEEENKKKIRDGQAAQESIEVFSTKLNAKIILNPSVDLVNMSVPIGSLVYIRKN